MAKPDFGEIQLQTYISHALARYARENNTHLIEPLTPTLVEEANVFFDEGFFVPWLMSRRIARFDGCNLFFQYKLAELCGRGGAQYPSWKRPYLRFILPHRKADFHQLRGLKRLAREQCAVYYAANSSIKKSELARAFKDGMLLDQVAFLDVNDVTQNHRFATFTADSESFVLHSEPEGVRRTAIAHIFEKAIGSEMRPLGEDNEILFQFLSGEADRAATEHYVPIYRRLNEYAAPTSIIPLIKFHFLTIAFRQIFGLEIFRFITRGDG